MKSLNTIPENCRMSGAVGPGSNPGHGPAIISIRVSHGHNKYEVGVPSNSKFGYLKSVISQSLGLKLASCKLFFGGLEKQDDENIQSAGVENNSEVLLVEDTASVQQVPEEVLEAPTASKGEDAVAEVREEVNKLEQQVSALQAVIDSGKKVDDKEIVYLTEMLMRQLLKLDGIEAEGEGKVQRKTEVRRVQIIVETLDTLKSRNLNSSSNIPNNESKASEWTAFDPLPSSAPPVATLSPSPVPSPSPAPPVLPSSSLDPSTSPTPPILPSSSLAPTPTPSSAHPIMPSSSSSLMQSSAHPAMPSSSPSLVPSSSTYSAPHLMPSNMPQPTYSAVPHFSPPTQPFSNFPGMPYPAGAPMPYYAPPTHHPYHYYDPSQMTYFPPYTAPSPAPQPPPPPAPYHDGSSYTHHPSNPFAMPSTTITQNWEHFG